MNPEYQGLIHNDLRLRWFGVTTGLSNTKFSRAPFPAERIGSLTDRGNYEPSLTDGLEMNEVDYSGIDLPEALEQIPGMRELAYLQRLSFPMTEYFTAYRVVNFPTPRKIADVMYHDRRGNGEQARLMGLYGLPTYQEARGAALANPALGIGMIPQERIVKGLPVFNSVTDAIGIHGNFRDPDLDAVILMVLGIPLDKFRDNKLELWSNPAVVPDYFDSSRDFRIPPEYFKRNKKIEGRFHPSRQMLGRRGIHLFEMYLKGLPIESDKWGALGVEVKYFLTELRGIVPNYGRVEIEGHHIDDSVLSENHDILYGMWGGSDGMGAERNPVAHLPFRVWEIVKE